MTRKDFELIAGVFREEMDLLNAEEARGIDRTKMIAQQDILAKRMAYALRSTNPRFDVDRFLAACGAA